MIFTSNFEINEKWLLSNINNTTQSKTLPQTSIFQTYFHFHNIFVFESSQRVNIK